MDPIKDLKLDVNRIILQLFIPGVFAIVPFFLYFLDNFPTAKKYFQNSDGMSSLAIFILSIALGLILEDIGSVIEYYIWDKLNKKKYPTHETEWNEYLKLDIPNDCDLVAQRYLKTIIIRMKFELSFAVAMVFTIIGLLLIQLKSHIIDSFWSFIICCIIVPLGVCSYLLYESHSSSVLLIKTRKKILDKLKPSS